jgi:hypothetical protein
MLAVWASAGPSFGQSLGEAAQKEKARREREKKAGVKVFTDDDLGKTEAPRTEGSTQATTPPPSAESSSEPSSSESGAPRRPRRPSEEGSESQNTTVGDTDEGGWKSRAASARATLQAAEQQVKTADGEVERLKQDLNPMSTTFSTDPYVIQRLQGQLTEAEAKAAAARQALKEAQTAFSAFEDEARRAGVPPGWIRE